MLVNELMGGRSFLPIVQQREQGNNSIANQKSGSFVDTLKEFVTDVNSLQVESSDSTARMLKGEPVDIHDVMISSQKAKTSFELLLELRNKGLDLYKETMRIQV
ncbi:MAG: flagellar hook-basal body complex protein FliE [Candidatus Kapabacteria bacterium]|jgi:flagellar hook-basal body complex protein FliE|nr:flagellar hook-basal body complex protein FliE [Candidatus Kapabacteria bacterium]